MAKGNCQARNPLEKLQALTGQLENAVDSIMDAASKPDFSTLIQQLKTKREGEALKKTKLNKEGREISKLLVHYPGLSRQILSGLKSKIAEYKALAVIDKYKTDLPAPERKKKSKADK